MSVSGSCSTLSKDFRLFGNRADRAASTRGDQTTANRDDVLAGAHAHQDVGAELRPPRSRRPS